jgi:hypothetical protein
MTNIAAEIDLQPLESVLAAYAAKPIVIIRLPFKILQMNRYSICRGRRWLKSAEPRELRRPRF